MDITENLRALGFEGDRLEELSDVDYVVRLAHEAHALGFLVVKGDET